MKYLILPCILGVALAQAPNAKLLDSNSKPLGAQLTFQGLADIYGKLFTYKADCTKVAWSSSNELGTGSANYYHYPPADATGWAGYWCYGIDTGAGPVSIPLPVTMGMKWYVNLFYMTPDCSARLPGANPPQFGVVVTRTRNGVAQVMPQIEGVNPYRYAGFMRMMSYDTVDVQITLPDGKVLDFPHAFQVGGAKNVDDAAPYLVVELNSDGSDSQCSVQAWTYPQKGVNNQ